jgi:hypothetical protein
LNISVSASFVWRCLSGSTMTPFPHLAHRSGHADFPHPACMGLFLSRAAYAIFVVFPFLFDRRRVRFVRIACFQSLSHAAAVEDGASSAPPRACP